MIKILLLLATLCSPPAIYEQHRRLTITNLDHSDYIPFGRHVSSLLFLFTYHQFLKKQAPFDASLPIVGLYHLKVLDLENIHVSDFPSEIGRLVLLKYLVIRGDFVINSLLSLQNLQNLETLIVRGALRSVRGVDDNVTGILIAVEGMSKLRHLWLGTIRAPISLYKHQNKVFQFSTVQTLGLLDVDCPEAAEFLRCFPNLRKLKCIFGDFKEQYPNLDFLQKLEALNISLDFYSSAHVPKVASLRLPTFLRQVTLSRLSLPWEEMSRIGRLLPIVEVLKLLEDAFEGPEWDMEADEVDFPQLKFLKLECLDIMYWKMAYVDQFPKLQQLVLCNCEKLEKIPDSFAEIESLKRIKMEGSCTSSAIQSGEQIKELQQDYDPKFEFIAPYFEH